MSNFVRPHRQQPTRLPHLWDSPSKNTGVGCHFLLQCMKVKSESEVAQSCLTLSDPMDCSPPGSSVHGIFQARVLEWGAIAFSNNPTTEHIPWENHNWKRHMYPSVCCNSRTWKQPTCPLIEVWIKKLRYTYTMEYYSAIKNNAFESVLMRWMNLDHIIQSEVSQKEKNKYHILRHIHGL